MVSCDKRIGVRRYPALGGHLVLYEGFRMAQSQSPGYASAREYTWVCGQMMPLAGSVPSQSVREARDGRWSVVVETGRV